MNTATRRLSALPRVASWTRFDRSDPSRRLGESSTAGARERALAEIEAAQRRIELLEEQLLEARGQVAQTRSNNEKLTITIQQTRDQIAALRDEVEKLTQPPAVYGTFVDFNDDGTVDVFASGTQDARRPAPRVDPGQVARGDEVVLNESFTVIGVRDPDGQGEVVTVKEVLDERRVLIYGRADEERVVELADSLRACVCAAATRWSWTCARTCSTEKLVRQEAEELVLEEVPDISYADVGGLDAQIESITDAVELPYLHRELSLTTSCPHPRGSSSTARRAAERR